jgi:predicted lipoprotein
MDIHLSNGIPRQIERRGRVPKIVGVLLAVVFTVAGCAKVPGVYVAVKEGSSAQDGAFSAKAYADRIWASKVIPAVLAKAVDASTVLAAIKANEAAANAKYGVQSGSSGGADTFLVKGSGAVQSVQQQGGAGELMVTLTAGAIVNIAIGPAFLGTAIRDGVGFIEFGQFTNQIDYAAVATALNSEVRSKIVGTLDLNTIKGKTVTFAGAFQLLDPQNIVVTPVKLEVS